VRGGADAAIVLLHALQPSDMLRSGGGRACVAVDACACVRACA
jgi:hypothetical protein